MNVCILESLHSRRVTPVLTNTRTYMVVHGALEEVLLTMWPLRVALCLLVPGALEEVLLTMWPLYVALCLLVPGALEEVLLATCCMIWCVPMACRMTTHA